MAKVSGCLCWPKMSQSKTKVPKESSSQLSAAQNSTLTLDPTGGDRRCPSIPKEHDDFIEMLFRPGRPRSRTLLTTSLFPQPQKRRSGDGSGGGGGGGGGWFRRRTNSLLSAKRYSLDEDRQLFDTVPATPPPPGGAASFQREFSFTLPLRWTNDDDDDGSRTGSEEAGARGGRAARRSTAVWPEYIWRLSEKRQQQRCLCAGCEDAATTAAAAACARVYRHPVRHSDAVAECLDDDEDEDGAEESGLDRRGARGYDRPKSRVSGGVRVEVEPYDVPAAIGSNDWMFFGRGSLRDRSGDWRRRTKSAEFQARPRSASLEQRAFRNAAASAQGRSARGGGGGEDAPDFPAGSWGRCGHQSQPHYDRPVGLYPLRPAALPGHRRGCHGGGMMALKGSFGLRCFACELKLETMMGEEWNRVEGYHLPGRGGHRSHFAYDAGDSGYIQSDQQETVARSVGADGGGASQTLYPELNYVIPSGMFADRKRAICCHDDNGDDAAERDDYLTPLSENFRRFQLERDQSERYLAMSSGVSTRERNEAFSAEETERQKQTTKVPDEIDRQREKESCDEEIRPTSDGKFLVSEDEGESDQKPEESPVTSGGKSVRYPVEGEPEGKEKVADDSVENISTLADQEEGNEVKNTATSVDANSPPSSENKEPSGGSVRPKESTPAPPVATRPARSHLDLLHMSPPPQCSFMVDHAYMNVTDSGNETKSAPLKNDGGLEEKRSKQQNVPKNNVDSIEEVAEEIYCASKTKSGNEYLAHWQDVARLNKQPGSQYVVLHKKASSGNNYCHTYLPTLRENLKNSCKTK